MTEDATSFEKRTRFVDIPLTLRGEISALLVIGSVNFTKKQKFMVYYILSDGIFFLKDTEINISSRNFSVKKGDMICILTNKDTGFEEFYGRFDDRGNWNPNVKTNILPMRLQNRISHWRNERPHLIDNVAKLKQEEKHSEQLRKQLSG